MGKSSSCSLTVCKVPPQLTLMRLLVCAVFFSLLSAVSGFNTITQLRSVRNINRPPRCKTSSAVTMSFAEKDVAKAVALAPVFTALPAFAEGTGEILGITDNVIFGHMIGIVFVTFLQFVKWSSQQEDEDFFDSYDQRRTQGEWGRGPLDRERQDGVQLGQ